jgi:hypothetical protein
MQQENDRLRARRFQLELKRGDRLQRIVDLEVEVHNLEEDTDAHEIERLTVLQNIADMQQQVEEAEVQVAALQAIVALQPLPPVQALSEEQQGQSGLDQMSQAGPPLPTVVWTSLGPLPRWVPGPTTRWAPGTTRLELHGT